MPELVWGHSQVFGCWLPETGREPPHRQRTVTRSREQERTFEGCGHCPGDGERGLTPTEPTSVGSVGVITIDERSCMVCGRCASICLTTPLILRQLDSALEVTFDFVMCVGCSMRLTTYTERENGAIMLRTSFDVRQPHRGRHTDCSSSTSRREICQVRLHTRPCSMLGPHHRGDHRSQGRRCVGCR
jgi:Pyruvate/2-oxoacid:ferredoxin oxidoreductase delta subunit